jgi:hypothetical protein
MQVHIINFAALVHNIWRERKSPDYDKPTLLYHYFILIKYVLKISDLYRQGWRAENNTTRRRMPHFAYARHQIITDYRQ